MFVGVGLEMLPKGTHTLHGRGIRQQLDLVGQHSQVANDLLGTPVLLAETQQGAELGFHPLHRGGLVIGDPAGALQQGLRMGP